MPSFRLLSILASFTVFASSALAAVGFFLPKLLGGTSVAYSTLTTIAIFAVMCYGIDIVLSYLGEVSLGHTLFWAIGGYTAANLSVKYGLNGWTTALATIALCIVAAGFLGAVTLRTREFVFSLVTYAAAVVGYEIAFNWDAIGGSDGIVGIAALKLPFGFASFVGASQEDLWPVAFVLLLLTLVFIARFRRSKLGTTALMVQMNPALAASLGVDPRKVRVAVFVISAPITGLAGWLYAYQRAYVGPDMFETYFLVLMLTSVVLVGRPADIHGGSGDAAFHSSRRPACRWRRASATSNCRPEVSTRSTALPSTTTGSPLATTSENCRSAVSRSVQLASSFR